MASSDRQQFSQQILYPVLGNSSVYNCIRYLSLSVQQPVSSRREFSEL